MLTTMFVGCTKDETVSVSNEPFTLRLTTEQNYDNEPQPMSAATRSEVSDIDNFVAQAFSDDSYTTAANIFDDGTESSATNATGEFAVTLDRTKDYYLLLWADEGDGTYNTDNLNAVVPNKVPFREAFAGKLTIAAGSTSSATVSLKRAVAKISMRNTVAMEADKSIEVGVNPFNNIYNVATSSASLSDTALTVDQTLTTTAAEAGEEFAFVWLLASAEQQTLTITYNYEEQGDNIVENVPYQANRRTDLKGEYFVPPTGTYKIGDTYPKGGTAIGVVYDLTDDTDEDGYGDAGKIVSLDEAINTIWGPRSTNTNATDETNGRKNMATIVDGSFTLSDYPPFEWVHYTKNSGTASYSEDATGVWYLPAIEELKELQGVKSQINDTLHASGSGLSETWGWSSTEYSGSGVYAWYVDFKDGRTNASDKSNDNNVRAVLAF